MSRVHVRSVSDLGSIFDGPHATPKRTREGPYFLNITSLNDGRLDLAQSDHVTAIDFGKWTRRVIPQKNDLLFSYETRLGQAALMPSQVDACLGRRMALLRPDPSVVDPRFLLYFYLSPSFQRIIEQRTIHGATVNRISLSSMGAWQVEIPDLREQRAIAEVLGALDDKIAANTRLAYIADELVRTLHAQLEDSTQSSIVVGDVVRSVNERAEPASIDPATAYVGLEHVPRRSMWLDRVGRAGSVTSAKSRFESGDILFGKLRPYFHKVVAAPYSGVCSTDIIVLRPNVSGFSGFALAAIASDRVVARCTAASEGTRMPRTSWKDLATIKIGWPGEAAATAFSEEVEQIRDSASSAIQENILLSATRDALLPHLMSGKLRVKDAEKIVSDRT